MRRVITTPLFAVLSFGLASIGRADVAAAAEQDGAWSVLVVTEKGDCDRGYRYNVRVAAGRISYDGDTGINVAGTVAANGGVRVSIRLGENVASGSGRLSATVGNGIWQGTGGGRDCAGRWEAERR